MNVTTKIIILMLVTVFFPGAVLAAPEGLVDKLSKGVINLSVDVQGCDEDRKKYCQHIPANSQKAFMCMMANEDNLSSVCKLGITEAALAMKMSMMAIDYSVRACELDADTLCLNVKPGEGKIVACLKKNESKVSKDCVATLKKTGLWDMPTK